MTQINRIVAGVLVAQTLQMHLLHRVVKLMPNLALVLPQRNAHDETFVHLKNVVCSVKLIILVRHELMQAQHLLLQQDLVLLHRVVLLMRVVVNQPIIVIPLHVKGKSRLALLMKEFAQKIEQAWRGKDSEPKQRLNASRLLHLQHAKQPLLVQRTL